MISDADYGVGRSIEAVRGSSGLFPGFHAVSAPGTNTLIGRLAFNNGFDQHFAANRFRGQMFR